MKKYGFSWKRFLGITRTKTKISRTIGIPLTKSGIERRLGHIIINYILKLFK